MTDQSQVPSQPAEVNIDIPVDQPVSSPQQPTQPEQPQNQEVSTTSPQETQPIETTPPVVQSESSSDAVTQQEEKPQRDEKGQFIQGNQESVGVDSGRPCKFCENKEKYMQLTKDYFDKCFKASESGKAIVPYEEELALILKVNPDTLVEWSKKKNDKGELEHPEFSATRLEIKTLQKLLLLKRTLGRFNPTGAIFQLKVNHGAIETEKKIVAGDSNEPLSITIIEEKKLPEDE